MPELIALDVPAGPGFVEALRRIWDDGDAVAPLDPRLPRPAAAALLEALAPAAVVGPDGERRSLPGGRPVEPGDALVLATSGTTGRPKGVVHTHAALAASATATNRRLGVDPDVDVWLACLPLAHIGGLAVVTRALLGGIPLTVLPGFDAAAVERAAAVAGAAGRQVRVSLVATALRRVDAALFATVLLGGAAPPGGLPPNVVVTYGMTETGSGVVYDGQPLDGVEVTVGDGRRGARGEVLVRGPMLLRCYRDGTDPRTADGWLPTGDSGRLDATGRLHVDGRMADVVVTGGEKVWPAAVEQVISTMPGVAEVAVGGRPDPEWGQRVVAYVVPVPGATPPPLADVRAAVRAELAPWAAPRQLVHLEALPRTPGGKVRRAELADLPADD